jgi:SAM-dependent methyltransferase
MYLIFVCLYVTERRPHDAALESTRLYNQAQPRPRECVHRAKAAVDARGLSQVRAVEIDLAGGLAGLDGADGAWCRWIFAFLPDPLAALAQLAAAIRPGGALVIHEYLDYSTWRLFPRSAPFERFVAAVMASWRIDGGESDIGPAVACQLAEMGWRVELKPVIDVVTPGDLVWRWPSSFVAVNSQRLVDLGRLDAADAADARADLSRAEAGRGALMATPTLLVSVMAVNNEIGVVQPLAEIGALVKAAEPSASITTSSPTP